MDVNLGASHYDEWDVPDQTEFVGKMRWLSEVEIFFKRSVHIVREYWQKSNELKGAFERKINQRKPEIL